MYLDGKKCAESKIEDIRERVSKLNKKPSLAIIMISEDKASKTYVNNKVKRCMEVGITPRLIDLPETVEQFVVEGVIKELNEDSEITGIILQLPIPDHLDASYLGNLINYKKDVDGFTTINTGLLSVGRPCLVPCTPKGIIELLDFYNIDIESKDVLIINRSDIVGKPLAQLFLQRNATVTVAHSKTKDLRKHIKHADIIVTAVGIPNFFSFRDFTQGSTIVDVSINFVNGKMCGDVTKYSYGYLDAVDCNITPVPGGVGQMTVIALLENILQIAKSEEEYNYECK